MFDKIEALAMLIRGRQEHLRTLLAQRSAYGGHDVPEELQRQIELEQRNITALQVELEILLKDQGELMKDWGKEVSESTVLDEVKISTSVLARVPHLDDLLPILIPHNLVVDLQEHRRVQEVAFSIAGVMLGGALGIVVNWLTAETWGTGQTFAAWVSLIAFAVGALLSWTAGWWWGYLRAKRTERQIDLYVKGMQIVRMPYISSTTKPSPEGGSISESSLSVSTTSDSESERV